MARKPKLSPSTHVESSKVDAKLRMFANANQPVNEIRAEFSGSVAINKKATPSFEQVRFKNPVEPSRLTKKLKKKKLNRPSNDIVTNVFVELSPSSTGKIPGEVIRKSNLVSARLAVTDVKKLADRDDVIGIENSRMLKVPRPLVTDTDIKKPPAPKFPDLRKNFKPRHDALIGIIDVGGFDFAHPDFLDTNGNTRFRKIWDQGGTFRKSPAIFHYGAEFDGKHLNMAIRQAKKVGVPATSLEKQSQITIGSHGTHVSSIAAGNSGIFPDAEIIGVTIALKDGDIDRRKSFYDSACLIHAIEYILAEARGKDKKDDRPVSINISLGTNGHAHDGSDVASRWIDAELITSRQMYLYCCRQCRPGKTRKGK